MPDVTRGDGRALSPPRARDAGLRALCAVLGLCPVAALLAWVFGLGPFAAWFWALSAPAILALCAIGLFVSRGTRHARLRTALVAGTAGGLLGTLGYDVFRLPFAAFGTRVFAPIDSYGVLLLGAPSSSPRTSIAGWAFHFSNGVGFGIAYACVALGARWWWGVAWGLTLETATIVTPFAGTYALRGAGIITIAYAAHLAYGAPLGVLVQHGGATATKLAEIGPRATTWLLVGTALALVAWLRPFSTPSAVRAGEAVAPGPSAVVRGGRFQPEWLRVAPGGCVTLRNDDAAAYAIEAANGRPAIVPGATRAACFARAGIHRVRLGGAAYSGGFVIVDEEAA